MTHRPKRYYRHMSREKAEQIRRLYFSRAGTQKEIGRRFGIGQNTVSRIVSGYVWT